MIKLLSLIIAAALFLDAVEQGLCESPCDHPSEIVGWTEWFDRDNPGGTGDWETLINLRNENPGKICSNPLGIEVRTVSGLSVAEAGEVIFRNDKSFGFVCRNEDQTDKYCNDYKVRFSCPPTSCSGNLCWTNFFNRDRAGGIGDWELLEEHKEKYPGEICDNPLYIQAVTTDTMTLAINAGQKIRLYNPTVGFSCINADQTPDTCKDYKVRYVCPCT